MDITDKKTCPERLHPNWTPSYYDAVFVEDLNVSGMLQSERNARNKQIAAWRGFIEILEYKATGTARTSSK